MARGTEEKYVDWIVFYTNDRSFSSDDGLPGDAPREDVQCIAFVDPTIGNRVLAGQDWYCWHFEEDCWVPHSRDGMLRYIRKAGTLKVALEGYEIARGQFNDIRDKARRDPRLPPTEH